jgi:acetylornithine deacetylase/succinyl-diaminopimelate desuccinylase-like protein
MIHNSMIELCKRALSVDSSIVNGTTEFTEFLTELASSIDLEVEVKNYLFRDLDFQNILITQNKNYEKIKYLFVNPLDTEAPGPFRSWTQTDQDPFDITIKDGKMFGLGANCGKLNNVLLLKAISELEESKREKFALLGTYGREVRAHGALRYLKEKNISPLNLLVGFPTSNQVVHAQAGRIRMRINFPFTDMEKELKENHDEQEHSSSESQYFHSKNEFLTEDEYPGFNRKNAIVEALHFIENLPDQLLVLDFAGGKDLYSDPRSCLFEFDLVSGNDIKMGQRLKKFFKVMSNLTDEFKKYKNEDFRPEYPMLHLGRVVCDLEGIEFWGECIFPPGIPEIISEAWIKKLREEIINNGGSSKLLSQRWPYVYRGTKGFLNQLLVLNETPKPKSLSYTSEADLFELVGFKSLIFGPGDFNQMFKPNESISLKGLEHALNFYKKILNELE